MSIQSKELIKSIESLPEDLQNKILEYVEYIKFIYVTNDIPEELVIKDNVDLKAKLEEGIKDIERGNVCSMEEAFAEVNEVLED